MMSSFSLLRLGAVAATIGGIVLVLSALLALFGVDYSVPSEAAATGLYNVRTMSLVMGGILTLAGLVAIHAYQVKEAGFWGLATFVIAFLGMALTTGAFWADAFVAPTLALEAPHLLNSEHTTGLKGPLDEAFLFSFGLGSVGLLLFGLTTFWARVYPRLASLLLLVGTVVSFLQVPGSEAIVAAAISWLGFSLLSKGKRRVNGAMV